MNDDAKPARRARKKATARARSTHGPTLRDVAERAGVSVATVSIILNETPTAANFAPPTRERVRSAASDLGYTINPLARALRRKNSGVLGCILFNHQDIYYTRLIDIAETYAREHGYDFVVSSMGYDFARFESCIARMLAWRVEGLLFLLGGRALTPAIKRRIRGLNLPYVIGDSVDTGHLDSAALFSYRSGSLLAEHLLELGHRSFAVAGVNQSNIHSSERLRGVTESLADAGIAITRQQQASISPGEFGANAGLNCAQTLLKRGAPFTALICLNDLIALGALTALRESGVSVPDQCSVAGFDDIALDSTGTDENRLGRYTAPSLTTVRLPTKAFGREAMRRLISQIGGESDEGSYSVELYPKLVMRDSTAPPPMGPS